MKRDLNNQYQQWQEQIDSWELNRDINECFRIKTLFDNDIKVHQDRLEVAVIDSSESEENKQEFKLLIEELEQIQVELNSKYENIMEDIRHYEERSRRLQDLNNEEQQGLSAQRLQKFEQFQADESFVDDQCVICMGDIEIGRNMMRLDCDGKHTFCQVCIEGWFAIKKTCPICRHVFQ